MYTSRKRSRPQYGHSVVGKGAYRKDSVLQTRVFNPEREKSVQSSMDYVHALVSPLDYGAGEARVPDFLSMPTQTSCIQLETTQTVNAFNCTGGYLYLTSTGVFYKQENAASTDAAITYPTTTLLTTESPYDATTNQLIRGAQTINAQYAGYRVVAAGILVEYIGNDANNQGQITAANLSSVDLSYLATHIGSQTNLENFRHNYTGAAKNGAYLRYFPVDPEDLVMGRSPLVGAVSIPTNRRNAGETKQWGMLQWHVGSMAVGSAIRVSIRVHVEGLINTEGLGVDTGVSIVDSSTMSAVTDNMGGIAKPQQGVSKSQMESNASAAVGLVQKIVTSTIQGVRQGAQRALADVAENATRGAVHYVINSMSGNRRRITNNLDVNTVD